MWLFVYGTLMKNQRYHDAYLAGRYRDVQPAWMDGVSLYFLEDEAYPVLVEGGDGRVTGEIYELSEKDLPSLDYLEGLADKPPLFARVVREVTSLDQTTLAEVYLVRPERWNEVKDGATPIQNGDFAAFIASREKEEFKAGAEKLPF